MTIANAEINHVKNLGKKKKLYLQHSISYIGNKRLCDV